MESISLENRAQVIVISNNISNRVEYTISNIYSHNQLNDEKTELICQIPELLED